MLFRSAERVGRHRPPLFHQPVRLELVVREHHLRVERRDDAVDRVLQQDDPLALTRGARQHQLEEERLAEEAAAEVPPRIITPEEREQEQRMLSGLNLPGMRLTGNIVDARATLAKLKEKLQQYVAEGKKGEITKTRNALEEQQKIVDEMAKPVLTPEQQTEKRAQETAAQVRKDVEHAEERRDLKKRQAEMRRKEGIELAQKKRAELQKELVQLQVDQENAKTKKLKESIGKEIAAKEKELAAVKAKPTEAPEPQSKRAKGPATRKIH